MVNISGGSYRVKIQLPLTLFNLRNLWGRWAKRVNTASASVLREADSEDKSADEHKAYGQYDQKQGSYSASERSTPDSQNTGKSLVIDYRIDPSLPHLCPDIPLSSTDRDDCKEEYDHVGAFE